MLSDGNIFSRTNILCWKALVSDPTDDVTYHV